MRRWILLVTAAILMVVLATTAIANNADWSLKGPPELPLGEYDEVERPVCVRRTLDQAPLQVGNVNFMVDVLTVDISKVYPTTARVFRTDGEGWRIWPSHGEIESELGDHYAKYRTERGASFVALESHWDHMIIHHDYVPNQPSLNNATDVHFSLTFDTYRERPLGFTPGPPVTLEFEYTLRLDECP